MLELFLAAFVTFFVVIDPPGLVPLFIALTQGMDAPHRRRLAQKICRTLINPLWTPR